MSATQKFFRKLFGETGTRAPVPDPVQGDGSVSYEQGYGADYQRAPADPLVKNIERDKFNQLMYDLTLSMRQYQTRGFPEFVTAADNGGTPYPYGLGAYVQWTDGLSYVSLVNANTSDPTDSTKWLLVAPSADVGMIGHFPAVNASHGWIKADGVLRNRADYPYLWAYAQASGNVAVSDAAWASAKGMFSPGNGTTTFRPPALAGYHVRAWDDGAGIDPGRGIGSIQADQNQVHNHGVNDPTHAHTGSTSADGAHSHSLDTQRVNANDVSPLAGALHSGTGVPSGANISVDGSHTHTFGTSASATGISIQNSGGTETRVKTIALLACIKYR
jgi:hypothetical protein